MARDETYVIDLCDRILGVAGKRQHRFRWLTGDPGKRGRCAMLPVDAYYESFGLVIEYRERQHSEAVPFMDRKDTISGCKRGEQRRIYDERRRSEIPRNDLTLVELDYSQFGHDRRKKLLREQGDEAIVRTILAEVLTHSRRLAPSPTRHQ